MTDEQNKMRDEKDTHIPPPTDPYVTYQTPYPRDPSQEVQNPFIEFRRLADSAFSSFFSGLPRFLGTEKFKQANIRESDQEFEKVFDHHAKEFERRIAEMVKARTKEAEGFRKQLEQEWEEKRRVNEKRMEEENQRWEMMRRGLENCPGLRPDGLEGKREAETELDLYDGLKAYESPLYKPAPGLEASKAERCPWIDGRIEKKCPWDERKTDKTSWLSGLGWDGRRRAKNIPLYVPDTQEAKWRTQRNTEWQTYRDEDMDPFNDDDHVVPWLKLSPYSPLSLINEEAWGEAFGQAHLTDDVRQVLSDFPWDEAFEDLVAVHKTGRLPSLVRRLVYWGGPNQWMTDMALRGSLGSNWNEGFMVAALMGAVESNQWKGLDGLTALCKQIAGREFRKAAAQSTANDPEEDEYSEEEDIKSKRSSDFDQFSSVVRNAFEPRMKEVYREIEDLAETLFGNRHPSDTSFGARGMAWPTPEEIISAIAQGRLSSNQEEDSTEDGVNEISAKPRQDSLSSSSVTTSSWQSVAQEQPESLVSTFTTTTTRTLPDGSTEIKRVLKKRFADGSEESSESTEVKPLKPTTANVADAGTQTTDEESRKRESKNGWFWN